ncbi:type II secretion system protein [bacterium]|nr:type II secretion system protein [bacterium]
MNTKTRIKTSKAKKAFTLAEVLITIGVIGVVAALTIPALITNINSRRYKSGLKKTISTLNQAVRMSQAKYDFNFADLDNPFAEGMEECSKQNPENVKTICSLFNGTLSGITYLGNVEENATLKSVYKEAFEEIAEEIKDLYAWQLSDGAILFIEKTLGDDWYSGHFHSPENYHGYEDVIWGYIDLNGISKPNKYTRCSDNNDFGFEEGGKENSCVVKNKDINDIYGIFIYDSTVEAKDNATAYVLNM